MMIRQATKDTDTRNKDMPKPAPMKRPVFPPLDPGVSVLLVTGLPLVSVVTVAVVVALVSVVTVAVVVALVSVVTVAVVVALVVVVTVVVPGKKKKCSYS